MSDVIFYHTKNGTSEIAYYLGHMQKTPLRQLGQAWMKDFSERSEAK